MAKLLQPVTACLKKGKLSEKEEYMTMEKDKEREMENNKEVINSGPTGLLWGVSSRLYNIGTGAVGIGVESVKWAASTTYTVGSGVVATAQTVVGKVVPSVLPKPKKE